MEVDVEFFPREISSHVTLAHKTRNAPKNFKATNMEWWYLFAPTLHEVKEGTKETLRPWRTEVMYVGRSANMPKIFYKKFTKELSKQRIDYILSMQHNSYVCIIRKYLGVKPSNKLLKEGNIVIQPKHVYTSI